jgi:O-antigen/teichoic acid export membrane protein
MSVETSQLWRRLTRTSAVYLVGGLAQQAVGFLLLPVYISLLNPHEYGTLEIMNTTGVILLLCVNLGLPSAIVACYHRDCDSAESKAALLGTAFLLSVPMLALGSAALALSAPWLGPVVAGAPESARLLQLVAAWVFLNGVLGVFLAIFRAREEAAIVTGVSLASFVLLLALNILFVYVLGWGVQGILLGNALSSATAVTLCLPFLRGRVRATVDWRLVRPLLVFGLLIVPAALAGWIMNMSNRYFLGYYDQLADVGIYSLGHKFGLIIEVLVVTPFQLAWPAFAFSIGNRSDHGEIFARTLTYLVAIGMFCALAIALFSWPLLEVIGRVEYRAARSVILVVALAYVMNAVHYCASPVIHLERRSRYLTMLIIGASILNIILNVLLIPTWGMLGAAWSTIASFAALAVGTVLVANRIHPIQYEYGRLTTIGVASAIGYAVGMALIHSSSGSPLLGTIFAGTALLVYGAALMLLGFFTASERAHFVRAVRQSKAIARRLAPRLYGTASHAE